MNSSVVEKTSPSPKKIDEIFIVAGEMSGDEHGALAVAEFKKLSSDFHFFGMGGRNMRAAGVETVVDSEDAGSVMGLTEVFSKIGVILKARKKLISEIRERKPKLAVLIDFPDFNFSLFKTLEKEGIKVIYYITPQLWAWRKGRAAKIKRYVSKVLSIFPFEEDFFKGLGINSKYIGHPYTDRKPLDVTKENFYQENGLDLSLHTLALLPGSRNSEIERLLPPMVLAFKELKQEYKDLQCVIPVAENLNFSEIKEKVKDTEIVLVKGAAREVLSFADIAVVASGTATVEAAMCKIPFVVIYKLAPLTYRLARILIKGVTNFGMVNLIAEKQIVPELLQDECSPENIAKEISRIIENSDYRASMLDEIEKVSEKLKVQDSTSNCSSQRVAKEIFSTIEDFS